MEIVRTRKDLSDAIRRARALGKVIGLVPTMGALHTGHISLLDQARLHANFIVATIFVNPAQFGPNEDFSKYPRTEETDVQALTRAQTDLLYMPDAREIYPPGFATSVHVGEAGTILCGAFRPGHFDGVATVVTKLFMQVMPDVAVFGEKDFQQLHIIRQTARDLDIHVRILGAAVIREEDGLAMSSRNRYLNGQERKIAPKLFEILRETMAKLSLGVETQEALESARKQLLGAGFTSVDYVELRDAATLATVTELTQPSRLLAAARLGTTRLIDNIEVIA